MWYVYILKCSDGTLYTGTSTDVEQRLREHNESKKGARYTRSRRPVKLVYSKQAGSRSKALSEEYRIRHLSHSQKETLFL